jgi:hypothetical protein
MGIQTGFLRAAVVAAGMLVMSAVSAAATTVTFNVSNITNNNPADAAAGENQLFVDVVSTLSGGVDFVFRNVGPVQMTIANIYFDFGATSLLTGGALGAKSPGVLFVNGSNPGNPPGGNAPAVNFTTDLAFEADQPKPKDGVNIVEFQTVMFGLANGKSFADVIAAMTDGDLRAAMHVINYASGGSESFVTSQVPLPAAGWMLLAGIGGLAAMRRRRKAA